MLPQAAIQREAAPTQLPQLFIIIMLPNHHHRSC
jgi:hypothetical protein